MPAQLSIWKSFSGSKRWVIVLFTLIGPLVGALPFSFILLLAGLQRNLTEAHRGFFAPFFAAYFFAGPSSFLAGVIFISLLRSSIVNDRHPLPGQLFKTGLLSGGVASALWGCSLLGISVDNSRPLGGAWNTLAILVVLGAFAGGACGLIAVRFGREVET